MQFKLALPFVPLLALAACDAGPAADPTPDATAAEPSGDLVALATHNTLVWRDGHVPVCIRASGDQSFAADNPIRCILHRGLAMLAVDGKLAMAPGQADPPGCNIAPRPVPGLTPLRFDLAACADLDHPSPTAANPNPAPIEHIEYVTSNKDSGTSDYDEMSTPPTNGFRIHLHDGNDGLANEALGTAVKTVIHETTHALGFVHEIRRRDAGNYVTFIHECWKGDQTDSNRQIGWNEESVALTPFDPDSQLMPRSSLSALGSGDANWFRDGRKLMPDGSGLHANDSEAACAQFNHWVTTNPNDNFGNDCPSFLLKLGHRNAMYCDKKGLHAGMVVSASAGGYSPEDVNAVFQAFEPANASCTQDAAFASAMAGGDFDGDGYEDSAVGGQDNSVRLYKGTMNGLVAWRTLVGASYTGWMPAGAKFGATLTSARLVDSSGKASKGASLFIGAPAPTGGAVLVFEPSPVVETDGYVSPSYGPHFVNAIASPPYQYDFGRAIKVGSFTGVNHNDLAISSKASIAGQAGSVFLYSAPGGQQWPKYPSPSPQPLTATADFGAALATGNLDADVDGVGIDELAIVDGRDVYVFGANRRQLAYLPNVGTAIAVGHETLVVGDAANSRIRIYDHVATDQTPRVPPPPVGATGFGKVVRVADVAQGRSDVPSIVASTTVGSVYTMSLTAQTATTATRLGVPSVARGGFGQSIVVEGAGEFSRIIVGAPSQPCGLIGAANGGALAVYEYDGSSYGVVRQFGPSFANPPTVAPVKLAPQEH